MKLHKNTINKSCEVFEMVIKLIKINILDFILCNILQILHKIYILENFIESRY